jgi:hypothetical protein
MSRLPALARVPIAGLRPARLVVAAAAAVGISASTWVGARAESDLA